MKNHKIIMNNEDKKKINKEQLQKFVNLNPDTKQYFFTKADERWLTWLWENGFLDVIKEKAKDPTRYGYRTPEINYLVKIATKAPDKVVEIILSVPITKETFNPEVVDQFLQICSDLPADQLTRVVNKIHDENWISLMAAFNRWGFQYEKMFKTLVEAKNFTSLLTLTEVVLTVRTAEEIKQTEHTYLSDNPFYFSDLSQTKIFDYMLEIDEINLEKAIAILTGILGKIIVNIKDKEERVFTASDCFSLYDVDFFTVEPNEDSGVSYRDGIKNLAAVIKKLAERAIKGRCDNDEIVNKLFDDCFATLPDSRSLWRLRLFILSLCPKSFISKLKSAYLRLFDTEHYYDIISGTEYRKVLKIGFPFLSEDDQREYIKKVFEYFTKQSDDEKENKYLIKYGSSIFSMIEGQLTADEKKQITEAGFTIDAKYEPEPSIGKIRGGAVVARGPITQDEFDKLPIGEIVNNLKIDWTPENLSKRNTSDDFLNPLNAEGVVDLLRNGIPKRLQEYIDNAELFFERGVFDQHYTYSFLWGIQETIKQNKTDISNINWDKLISLFLLIKKSGEEKEFEEGKRGRDTFDAWLSGWDVVHSAMADVIQELLKENNGQIKIDFPKYRDRILETLDYLLGYLDPKPEDEVLESAKSKTKSPNDSEYEVSDPFTVAINSVRGRAFEALALFIYQDGKQFSKEDESKIALDIKGLYKKVLRKENTRAMMFMFGRYLPSFYFRDKAWIQSLLPEIFSESPEKKYYYIAAWEGYLSNNLYEELFFDPEVQKLYGRGLSLTDADYPKQKHFREPDESLATHLALAYMYYKEFDFEHPLFKSFWQKDDPAQHANFVSFLGRSFMSGSNANSDNLLKKEPRSKQRLIDLWDWLLDKYNNIEPFIEFGFWISLEKDIFEPVWLADHVEKTLEKTKGELGWDYGLSKTIGALAAKSPEDTLKIMRLFWFDGGVHGKNNRIPFHIDAEWMSAFEILYKNPKTKQGVYTLIDDLIREGGSAFWGLKRIIDEN